MRAYIGKGTSELNGVLTFYAYDCVAVNVARHRYPDYERIDIKRTQKRRVCSEAEYRAIRIEDMLPIKEFVIAA